METLYEMWNPLIELLMQDMNAMHDHWDWQSQLVEGCLQELSRI